MIDHREIFSDCARWQSWLDVEAALAGVQGDLKIIPSWAAETIILNAKIEKLDEERIYFEIKKTGSPVFALVRIFADLCGEAGNYVHLGATTQNIIETGRLLILQKYNKILLRALTQILEKLKNMAFEHADTLMVGRTQLNHALPITFGFKVAGWINDFIILIEKINDTEKRLFLLRFGGAVGAFHSFGPMGQKLSEELARKLNLKTALVQGRSSPEGQLEYIVNLCSIGQLISKIASELYFLHGDGINELDEDVDVDIIGSSTMPHKINAKKLINLRANSSILIQKMAAVMSFTNPLNEGDASSNKEITSMFQSTCPAAIDLLQELLIVFDSLRINEEKMKVNAKSSEYFTASEALQMKLANRIGKLNAHDTIHDVSQKSMGNADVFFQILKNEPEIKQNFSENELLSTLKAENNLGQSAKVAIMASEFACGKISEISKKLDS